MKICCGDKTRTNIEVCGLFNNKCPKGEPISQYTVNKIEMKCRETSFLRGLETSMIVEANK